MTQISDETAMKERPILFSGEMVRAILAGRKTQTRRVIKIPKWYAEEFQGPEFKDSFHIEMLELSVNCPFGKRGDHLWVRETWQEFFEDEIPKERYRGPRGSLHVPAEPKRKSFVVYRADGDMVSKNVQDGSANWRPSIHMPRWASRITLEITDIKVERLQEISEEDAKAEGVVPITESERCLDRYRMSFDTYWDSIAKVGSQWDDNPWVWVVSFKRLT